MACKVATEKTRSCSMCNAESAKYTCPKCNVGYCSGICYKNPKHATCTEEFYRDWCLNTLNQTDKNVSKATMMKILNKRKEELDSDDDVDEDVPSLEERIEGVNLDDDVAVWELLTENEKSDFKRIVDTEAVNILPEWTPWWRYKEEHKLVEAIEDFSPANSKPEDLPPISSNILPITSLSVKTSPLLKYSLVNCLYAYIYLVKFYNGDHHNYPLEFITSLHKIGKSLENKGPTWEDTELALVSVFQQVQKDDKLTNTTAFLVETVNELRYLLQLFKSSNRLDHALRALTDIKALAEDVKNLLKKNPEISPEVSRALSLMPRKVLFYTSWMLEYGAREFQPLESELSLIYEVKLKELESFEKLQMNVAVSLTQLKSSKSAKVEEITTNHPETNHSAFDLPDVNKDKLDLVQ